MKRIILSILYAVAVVSMSMAMPNKVRFHNEATDTLGINNILNEARSQGYKSNGDLIVGIGQMFLDKPYVAHTLEGDEEMLTVNIDQLDCTTFVETVLAMAMTVNESRTSWHDFLYNLERLRYRGGRMVDYASRLHYNCDWVNDNVFMGIIEDATRNMPGVGYVVKSIDFMSANRDRYPSLADSTQYERVKNVEVGFRNHRFPYIKSADLNRKEVKAAFRNGDILALTSTLKNLDVTHMGIVVMREGVPYIMHASSSAGKVVVSGQPLADFMRRNRQFTGVRVIRLK